MGQTRTRSQSLLHTDEDAAAYHERLRLDPEMLQRLSFGGIQIGNEGDYYQCRACPSCGSQVNAPVTKQHAMALLSSAASVIARSLDQLVIP